MVLVCIGYRVWITVISTALSTDHMECGSSMLTVLRVSFCLFSTSILPTRIDDQHCPRLSSRNFRLSIICLVYPYDPLSAGSLSYSLSLWLSFALNCLSYCLPNRLSFALSRASSSLLSVVSTVYSAFDRPPPELNHLANRKSSR